MAIFEGFVFRICKGFLNISEGKCFIIGRVLKLYTLEHVVENIAYSSLWSETVDILQYILVNFAVYSREFCSIFSWICSIFSWIVQYILLNFAVYSREFCSIFSWILQCILVNFAVYSREFCSIFSWILQFILVLYFWFTLIVQTPLHIFIYGLE